MDLRITPNSIFKLEEEGYVTKKNKKLLRKNFRYATDLIKNNTKKRKDVENIYMPSIDDFAKKFKNFKIEKQNLTFAFFAVFIEFEYNNGISSSLQFFSIDYSKDGKIVSENKTSRIEWPRANNKNYRIIIRVELELNL